MSNSTDQARKAETEASKEIGAQSEVESEPEEEVTHSSPEKPAMNGHSRDQVESSDNEEDEQNEENEQHEKHELKTQAKHGSEPETDKHSADIDTVEDHDEALEDKQQKNENQHNLDSKPETNGNSMDNKHHENEKQSKLGSEVETNGHTMNDDLGKDHDETSEDKQHENDHQPEIDSEPEIDEHFVDDDSVQGQDTAQEKETERVEEADAGHGYQSKAQEREAELVKEAEDDDAYQSDTQTELDVTSKDQPPFMNESIQQSEAEPEPETKPEIRNGDVKTKDLAPVKRDLAPVKSDLAPVKNGTQQQQRQPQFESQYQPDPYGPLVPQRQMPVQYSQYPPRAEGYRPTAIRESRIKDRPVVKSPRDSAVKIKIELDLEVEVDLYARVRGDVTIGLM